MHSPNRRPTRRARPAIHDAMTALVAAPDYTTALQLAQQLPIGTLRYLADLLYLDVPASPRKAVLARRVVDEIRPVPRCAYSLACENVATTTIDCGPVVGVVQACQPCADLYGRLSGGGR